MFSSLFHTLKSTLGAILKFAILTARALWWIVRTIFRVILALARPSMRFVAFILFIVAVIALVADLTPFMDHGTPPSITTVAEHWKDISPLSLAATEKTVTNSTGQWAWQLLQIMVLNLPTFFIFTALGLLAAYLGRHRNTLNIYVN